MRRISEQDEFLLSCLLDDDLSPEQADALRERLEREPELRAALKSLSRVNELLVARRADAPTVDLRALHARVMGGVQERSARSGLLRLPFWVRLTVPLAVAAAVALVVTASLNRSATNGSGRAITIVQKDGPDQPVIQPSQPRSDDPAAFEKPARDKAAPRLLAQGDDGGYGRARVRFNRPGPAPAKSQIRVSYVRSTELANAVKARDEERRSRPSWTSYVAEVKAPHRVVVEDLPPL